MNRATAILSELRLDIRLRNARRHERSALIRLGEAAASAGPPDDPDLTQPLAQVRQRGHALDTLRAAAAESLAADRADYMRVARWMQPVVVVRGLCTRAILRHQCWLGRRGLVIPQAAIGKEMADRPLALARHPELVRAVADARARIRAILEERTQALEPYGRSALPSWAPDLGRESTVLGRAFWLQLRPNVLPRASALVGLAVGWWLADTYTDSHLKSVLSSLGLGRGGKRVVSGETYRTMMFWLPILAAGLFAYLADRAHLLIQRRYTRPTPPP